METLTQTAPQKKTKKVSIPTGLKEIAGRTRVIIQDLRPEIEEGRYPAKRVIGEELRITANIFSDGHDEVGALLLFRSQKQKDFQKMPMTFIENDHWEARLSFDETGFYEYTIQAFVDHFATWKHGLGKKFADKQNIETELLIGAELIQKYLPSAKSPLQKKLKKYQEQLSSKTSQESLYALAMSDELTELMSDSFDKEISTTYSKILRVEVERKKALFSTWYELFPRSTSQERNTHGTFKDVQKLLPGIAERGFDVLYLPPIHPIGINFRKGLNNSTTSNPGDPGSPWAIGGPEGGHKSLHPQLGSMEDFKELVSAAAEKGIEIALDLAYQCSPDHPYVKEHPQWFKWRPDGTVQYAENPPKKYQDVLPINFETEDWINLWMELKSVIDFWVDKGVKIFRVDNPHTKPFPFWEWVIAEVRKANPEVIFLAEAFTRPRIMERLGKIGFSQSYTYFTWRNNTEEMTQYLTELTKTEMRDYYRPNFWPNTPDILPVSLQEGGEAAFINRVIMAGTLSSNYGLYGPVYEFGINTPMAPGKEEYIDSEKYDIKHWDWHHETKIGNTIRRLNWIRKENPALQNTWNIEFLKTDNSNLLAYLKNDKNTGNRILCVVSFDAKNIQSGWIQMDPKITGFEEGSTFSVNDLLSGNKYQWKSEWNFVQLNPAEIPAHIFRLEDFKEAMPVNQISKNEKTEE